MAAVRTGAATHTGRVREANEDRFLTASTIFAVADGMGGHAAGEVASALVIARLGELGARHDLTEDEIRAGVTAANDDILADGRQHPDRAGMGTTVTGIALVHAGGVPHWAVFNVGDSRVYRFADGQLAQVTVDHSEVGELVAAGGLTAEEAQIHPRRNVVTRALGTNPGPEPDVWVLPPTPGERFVVCSDGLSLEVPDARIADLLGSEPDAQLAADRLVREAVDAGGRDNVTVVVVDYLPETADTAD